MPKIKKCGICGSEFTVNRNHRKYCSDECKRQVRHKYERVCETCGKTFMATKPYRIYCGHDCLSIAKSVKANKWEARPYTEEQKHKNAIAVKYYGDNITRLISAICVQAAKDIQSKNDNVRQQAISDVMHGGISNYLDVLNIDVEPAEFINLAKNAPKIKKMRGA